MSGNEIFITVMVSDTLDIGLEYADQATVGGASKEPDIQVGQTITWNNVGPLAASGGNVTITFQATITVQTFTVLTNTAYVVRITPSGGVFTDSDAIGVLPPLPVPVGGVTFPNDPVRLLAPWVDLAALAGLILAGAVVVVRKRVR